MYAYLYEVPGSDYLLTRSWWNDNLRLQEKFRKVVDCGMKDFIIVTADDFGDHLDHILEEHRIRFELMGCIVPNFSYLEGRSWFTRNSRLQEKLLDVVARGLGDSVNVLAPEFEEHIDQLLA
jgi:hypothetical protein